MNPLIPKAVWGFNGTERAGAAYLAAVGAGHNQKGYPVFNIYGRDVRDSNDPAIPEDVEQKLLQFARASLTVATMLRIPVYMHNVDEARIFRPSVWTEFGTGGLEAADFAACRNFGALYGKY